MPVIKPIYKKIIIELQDELEIVKSTNRVLAFELNYYKTIPYWKLNGDEREKVDELIFELLRERV